MASGEGRQHQVSLENPLKRQRREEPIDDTIERMAKRTHGDSEAHEIRSLPYLIVHEVTCTSVIHRHRDSSQYQDVPQLFRGDNTTSSLRGQIEMDVDFLDDYYAEENPNIAFVVVRTYNCLDYHHHVKENFARIPLPADVALILAKFKSHLTILGEDGPPANPTAEKIWFVSDELKNAMIDLRGSYPNYFSVDDQVSSLDAPYSSFYHIRSLLKDELGLQRYSSGSQEAHVTSLINYVEASRASEYQEADLQFAKGVVSQRHFSKLFCPDEIIIRDIIPGPVACTAMRLTSLSPKVHIEYWSWEFDGRFYRSKDQLEVAWPSEDKTIRIDSLSSYPLRFATQATRDQLYQRGQKFWQLRSRSYVECENTGSNFELQPTCKRYMIDLPTYGRMHPSMGVEHTTESEGIELLETPPKDPFLFLLPASVRGYGFHDKKWSMLVLDQVRPVKWNDETFDQRLVLKAQKKELIKALVTVHTAENKPEKADIIDGKGKGLILLLHGGLGTGKTLTAESIAEYARRPLYRVTCGDIGTDPEGVEKYLENALVSVFLRVLEYFEGILVLTSNRVGTFDEAFKSRVQLAMHYPPLDSNGRWDIWNMLLKDILDKEELLKYAELKGKLDSLARHQLNGRQIRNTINTARQLARYQKKIFAYTHLEQALDVVNEFEEYVTNMRGHTDEEYAQAQGHR